MAMSYLDQEPEEARPVFYIGQHDSTRTTTLTEMQYGQVLNSGFTYATTPVTNAHFQERIKTLLRSFVAETEASAGPSGSRPDPIVPPLTMDDTTLFPSAYTTALIAYSSPWIDLCSPNHVVASISRQVLNLEVSYANFCGVRSIIIPGPRKDSCAGGNGQGVAQYARAVQEALVLGTRLNFIIHLPMYREPGLEDKVPILSASEGREETGATEEIDIFSTWDSWHVVRSVCEYDSRLFVAIKMPHMLPEKELQSRWFSEPLQYLTLGPQAFQTNKAGHPSLGKNHQEMIFTYMRLKHAPYFLLCDVGPELQPEKDWNDLTQAVKNLSTSEFPTLAEAADTTTSSTFTQGGYQGQNNYVSYLRHLEKQQEPLSFLDQTTLVNFQDWLQSPLQPLSDNLESMTYEVFEGDPVKYHNYQLAIAAALRDWAKHQKPTSIPGFVVIAVAGSGRGPLVTRALRASQQTGVPVKVWAVEKNPNAYVYLLRQNQLVWDNQVTVVKTDMRAWKGPLVPAPDDGSGSGSGTFVHGKVDILVSELLGSFGDNELSPECLDGIQHVLAEPHGISVPSSYTAHLSPISTPRLYADIAQRAMTGGPQGESDAFNTPWVVRLFQQDLVAQKGVPDKPRFQQAWEFSHPLPKSIMESLELRRQGGVVGGGGGSMAGGVGANDHNARQCHLTFVCRCRGVLHGLAGYFEAVLYDGGEGEGTEEKVELSILPEQIQKKSRDMISWFPIFFPLKQPLYFPPDSELEVSMWRQTDDTKVWYEWLVEVFMWTGPSTRVKVGSSDMCSSRKVACLM